nr:hypothetical protein K-LCC10_0297 [Kaumoebavirus]
MNVVANEDNPRKMVRGVIEGWRNSKYKQITMKTHIPCKIHLEINCATLRSNTTASRELYTNIVVDFLISNISIFTLEKAEKNETENGLQ